MIGKKELLARSFTRSRQFEELFILVGGEGGGGGGGRRIPRGCRNDETRVFAQCIGREKARSLLFDYIYFGLVKKKNVDIFLICFGVSRFLGLIVESESESVSYDCGD